MIREIKYKKRDKKIEKMIRIAVTSEIRANPELLKEKKKFRKGRQIPPVMIRFFSLAWWLSISLFFLHKSAGGLTFKFILFSLFIIMLTSFMCLKFIETIYGSEDMSVLSHYPCSDKNFFVYQFRKIIWSSMWIPLFSAIFYTYISLGSAMPYREIVLPVFLFSGAQWFCGILAFMLSVRYLPSSLYNSSAFFPLVVLLGLCFVPEHLINALSSMCSMWILPALFPAGLINLLYIFGVVRGDLIAVLAAMSVFILIPYAWAMYIKLRDEFTMFEIPEIRLNPDVLPDDISCETMNYTPSAGMTEAEIKEKLFILASDEKQYEKWLDSWAWSFFSDSEKRIAGFFQVSDSPFMHRIKWGIYITIFGILLSALHPKIEIWGILIVVIGNLSALPIFGGQWEGLGYAQWSPGFAHIYSFFPLSYTKLSRIMIKTNLLRITAWFPFALISGGFIGLKIGSVTTGIVVSSATLLFLAALQPFIAGAKLHISIINSDLEFRNLPACIIIVFEVLFIAALIVSMIVIFFLCYPHHYWLVPAWILLTALLSSLIWWIHKKIYDAGIPDLIRPNTHESGLNI